MATGMDVQESGLCGHRVWDPGCPSPDGLGSWVPLTRQSGCLTGRSGILGAPHQTVWVPHRTVWDPGCPSPDGLGSWVPLTGQSGILGAPHQTVWDPGCPSPDGLGSWVPLTERSGILGAPHQTVWDPGWSGILDGLGSQQ
ncbi:fibrinogen alpha chain-like isoform X3 [Oncorhynchus mykiss]|uniref:fibrinogen alpha chain-like isoform X3 n=1 Tax=Oncorhynchus mykiss TaxID=8022 RepID=UPI001878958F|nr:fibrinogen alpha chain-like isoform X3 [Oncorhynchus mykiss]XP_036804598.1 fibrinogen alpha chain-like isoform X3 [Oncorhynchus mykiss]